MQMKIRLISLLNREESLQFEILRLKIEFLDFLYRIYMFCGKKLRLTLWGREAILNSNRL